MSSIPERVELGVHSTSVLSRTWIKNIIRLLIASAFYLVLHCLTPPPPPPHTHTLNLSYVPVHKTDYYILDNCTLNNIPPWPRYRCLSKYHISDTWWHSFISSSTSSGLGFTVTNYIFDALCRAPLWLNLSHCSLELMIWRDFIMHVYKLWSLYCSIRHLTSTCIKYHVQSETIFDVLCRASICSHLSQSPSDL